VLLVSRENRRHIGTMVDFMVGCGLIKNDYVDSLRKEGAADLLRETGCCCFDLFLGHVASVNTLVGDVGVCLCLALGLGT
jgi:hypothetical protein